MLVSVSKCPWSDSQLALSVSRRHNNLLQFLRRVVAELAGQFTFQPATHLITHRLLAPLAVLGIPGDVGVGLNGLDAYGKLVDCRQCLPPPPG